MFSIEYYTHNNKCPILDFLKSIPKKDAAKILKKIELLEDIILLNDFQKKSQKTTDKEIQRALTYIYDYIERNDSDETR